MSRQSGSVFRHLVRFFFARLFLLLGFRFERVELGSGSSDFELAQRVHPILRDETIATLQSCIATDNEAEPRLQVESKLSSNINIHVSNLITSASQRPSRMRRPPGSHLLLPSPIMSNPVETPPEMLEDEKSVAKDRRMAMWHWLTSFSLVLATAVRRHTL
jgi:hypothetical protein